MNEIGSRNPAVQNLFKTPTKMPSPYRSSKPPAMPVLYWVELLGCTHKYSKDGVLSNAPASTVIKSLDSIVLEELPRVKDPDPNEGATVQRAHEGRAHQKNSNTTKYVTGSGSSTSPMQEQNANFQ